MNKKGRNYSWLLVLVAIGLSFYIFSELIIKDPLLGGDDQLIVPPLQTVNSLREYFRLLFSAKLVDVQPVRDLSLLCDIWLNKTFSFWTFHLSSWLIWVVTLFLILGVVRDLYGLSYPRILLVLGLFFHPTTATSVAWISSRKHLLSFMFIVGATWVLVRANKRMKWLKKDVFLISLLYFLSLLSHPITSLWAVWAICYAWMTGRQDRPKRRMILGLGLPLIGLMVLSLGGQYYYYKYIFAKTHGLVKLQGISGLYTETTLLALGRAAVNIVYPFRLAYSYGPFGLGNIVGLLVLVLAGYGTFKRFSRMQWVSCWGLFFVPLVLVVGTQKTPFFLDTYLLVALFAVLLMMFETGTTMSAAARRGVGAVLLIVFPLLVFSQQQTANIYRSGEEMCRVSYDHDKSENNLSCYISVLLGEGNYLAAYWLAQAGSEMFDRLAFSRLLAKAVRLRSDIGYEEKKKLLSEIPTSSLIVAYEKVLLPASKNRHGEACREVVDGLTAVSLISRAEPMIPEEAAAAFCLECEKAGRPLCPQLKKRMSFLLRFEAKAWNDEDFQFFFRKLLEKKIFQDQNSAGKSH